MKGLLSDIRILDLTRMLAGPYGTMLLADLGAEVIKIEDHIGDHTRGGTQTALAGMNAYFLAVNRNKKSIVIDLKTEKGLAVFYDLVKVSDVVMDNLRPSAMKRLKCDYEDIKSINPRIISCSLSGFGHTGPYRDKTAFDLTIQALSGGMGLTGEPGGPPVRMGIPIGDLAGGNMAALAIVSALHYREVTGRGQKLDLSLLDCQISMTSYLTAYYLIGGRLSGRQGSQHESVVPYQAFETADIWLVVACVTEKFWEGLCIALEMEELILDDRFNSPKNRLDHKDELIPILQDRFLEKPANEWLTRLDKLDVPCAPVNPLDRALSDEQVLSRDMIIELDHPKTGKFKLAGNPIKASEAEPFLSPPPLHGEHTASTLEQVLGYTEDQIKALAEEDIIGVYKEESNGE